MTNISKTQTDRIRKIARELHKTQIAWRRHLHSYPELSFQEIETTKFLRKELKKLNLKLLPIDIKTGLLAEIKGKSDGPTVAIRTDIDALPIVEQSGLPFSSKNSGCMHACGHDMHMATVLGAASLLSQMKDEIEGTVRFIFQPAEEKPPGGARPMIENGALENVSAILGLHVDPHLPTGQISTRDGDTMASVFDFDLIINGVGGHAARPHTAVDAIATAAEVIDSIQKIISRETDPISPVVITFGKIEGGSARNVIADEVKLTGTARTLSASLYKKVPKLIKRTVSGICKARGATFEMNHIADYPVLSNDSSINRLLEQSYTALFGKNKIKLTDPVLGGEDFACYLQKVPGAMFRLGVMNKRIKADKPWHSPQFMADEEALFYGTTLVSLAALQFLSKHR